MVLVLPEFLSFDEALLELQRIGYDKDVVGWLDGGIHEWLGSGRETQGLPHISASGLRSRLGEANPPSLIDVRTPKEIERMRIDGSVSMPFDQITGLKSWPEHYSDVVVVCQSGYRASIAASIIQGLGCANISVLSGGMMAYNSL